MSISQCIWFIAMSPPTWNAHDANGEGKGLLLLSDLGGVWNRRVYRRISEVFDAVCWVYLLGTTSSGAPANAARSKV